MKFNAFRRRTIFLVVVFVLLASISGCLGVFEDSPEDLQQKFVDNYGGVDGFWVGVSGDLEDGRGSVSFDGRVRRDEGESYEVSGEYRGVNSMTFYSTDWRDGRLNVTVGDETYTVEGVERDSWGSVYEVNVSNRSRWSYVSVDEEVGQLLRSNVTGGGSDIAYLDPDDELVAQLVNKQFEAGMGKRVVNLSGSDIDEVEVQLMKEETSGDDIKRPRIRIEGQTKNGYKFTSWVWMPFR